MSRIAAGLLATLAVVMLPQYVAAKDEKRPEQPRHEARPQQPKPETKQLGRPNVQAIFARLDGDKDGKLSFEEFRVGWRRLCRFVEARVEARVASKDGPKDAVRQHGRQEKHHGDPKNMESRGPRHAAYDVGRPGCGDRPYAAMRSRGHDGKSFECSCCRDCPCCRRDMEFREFRCPCGCMGPRGPHGREFGEWPQHHRSDGWQSAERRPWGDWDRCDGYRRPEGRCRCEGCARFDGRRQGHDEDDEDDVKLKMVEARLTALERQQKVLFAAMREEHVAIMKTIELFNAKLAGPGHSKAEHKAKENTNGNRPTKSHGQKDSHGHDRND